VYPLLLPLPDDDTGAVEARNLSWDVHLDSRQDAPCKANVLSFTIAVVDGIHSGFLLCSLSLDVLANCNPHTSSVLLFFLQQTTTLASISVEDSAWRLRGTSADSKSANYK